MKQAFIIAWAVLTAATGASQAPASRLTFEVAAIRAASFPTPQTFQSGQFRVGTRIDGASLDFEFVTLADLVPYAYRVKSFQVAGPDWMRQLRWNIQAKLPAGSSRDQVPEMMQALLADRFKLTFHREQRQQPVYELVTRGEPKLEPAAQSVDDTAADNSGGISPGFGPFGIFQPGPQGRGAAPPDGASRDGRGGFLAGGITGNGTRISMGSNCSIHLEFDNLSMPNLADTLTTFLDRPVVDKTEMKGAYKLAMDFPIEAMLGMMQNTIGNFGFPAGQGNRGGFAGGRGFGPGGGAGAPGGGPLAGCIDPSVFAAGGAGASSAAIFKEVQKLGFYLQPEKEPFDTVIVDHLEKAPTEN
ncbi:MAG TPA: TIGR03435 family protein [Terriglobia bacterium]|jgi:uncharacterized protein (TIGR03435 family)